MKTPSSTPHLRLPQAVQPGSGMTIIDGIVASSGVTSSRPTCGRNQFERRGIRVKGASAFSVVLADAAPQSTVFP